MAELGQTNILKVNRMAPPGAYLQYNDEEVLLPNKYVAENLEVDDEVEVFVYKDSEDRLVATTLEPLAKVGEFAALKAVDVAPFGAFLDWGLEKHLLVPKSEMQEPMQVGTKYVVKVVMDHRTSRIVGVSKLGVFIDSSIEYDERQEVKALVVGVTDIGYKLLVNDCSWGLLYKNEVFQPIQQGDSLTGFVKKVREDGKLDISLRKPGRETQEGDAALILRMLTEAGGQMAVSDKSDPETIKAIFGLSKKAFKKAIGSLYKQKLITIEPEKIRVV
ncbi:MAG: hypothetical protein KDC79_14930 [Cyclobacteriaceae bacterium]|nr:hypothetical protein [Cyclobacteriaceae bacterium]